MPARHGRRSAPALAGREGARDVRRPMDEHLDPRRAVVGGQPQVIGRPLVAEGGGHRLVDGKEAGVAKGQAQLGERSRPFVRAMGHGGQVGHRQVHAAVGRVGRGRNGGGVRCPHGARRGGERQQARVFGRRRRQHFVVGAREAQLPQPAHVRPVVGQEEPLGQPQAHHEPHLGKPLKGCPARRTLGPRVGHGGEVPVGQARIVVGGAHQAIEVELGHQPSPLRNGACGRAAAIPAEGQAQ